jgi:hypothetical protein
MRMFKVGIYLLGLMTYIPGQGVAALIDATDPELKGTGLGAVLTIVTAHDNGASADGIEAGCVGWDGSADTIGDCVAGFEESGGDENTGASQTLTRLLSEVSGLDTIADIGLIVNTNEPGNDGSIDLTDLYFSVFAADGSAIFTAFLDPESIELVNGSGSGTGKSGFLFILDADQRADAMVAETAAGGFSEFWRIGGGFSAENIAGGPETVFVFRAPGGSIPPDEEVPPIPEPASLLLMGGGLLAVAFLRRRANKAA